MSKKIGCKKGQKVQVIIEEFGAVPSDVFVYCAPKDAKDHMSSFIKHHFGSKKRFEDGHGQTDKEDIYHYETKVR